MDGYNSHCGLDIRTSNYIYIQAKYHVSAIEYHVRPTHVVILL